MNMNFNSIYLRFVKQLSKIKHVKIMYGLKIVIITLTFVYGHNNYAADRNLPKFQETPLGYYKDSTRYHCGSIEPLKKLPAEYQLRFSPAKNQNPLGTCVSFATVACGEYFYPRYRFSEAELTVLAETRDGEDCKSGLFLGNTLSLVEEMGFVSERRFPYDLYLGCVAEQNGLDLEDSAWLDNLGDLDLDNVDICHVGNYNKTMREYGNDLRLYKNFADNCTSYRLAGLQAIHHVSKSSLQRALHRNKDFNHQFSKMRISTTSSSTSVIKEKEIGLPLHADIESVKQALYQGWPVAAAINVYGDWTNPVGGNIEMPQEISGDEAHAVVISGYNDKSQRFYFKNSWGNDWGNRGFGSLSYDYVKLYATELVAVTGSY